VSCHCGDVRLPAVQLEPEGSADDDGSSCHAAHPPLSVPRLWRHGTGHRPRAPGWPIRRHRQALSTLLARRRLQVPTQRRQSRTASRCTLFEVSLSELSSRDAWLAVQHSQC
jgi:hypothetical protein